MSNGDAASRNRAGTGESRGGNAEVFQEPYERPRVPASPPTCSSAQTWKCRASDGIATPLREPRLRGEHAGAGRRVGRRRGVRAVVQQRAPRHRARSRASRPTAYEHARAIVAPLRRRAGRHASCSSATPPRPSTSSPTALPPGAAGALHARRAPREHAPLARPRPARCSRSRTSPTQLLEDTRSALQRTPHRPARRHRRVQRHRRGVAARRARRARPRARRAALRRRRPARAAPRDRHGRDRDRPPRAVRAQAVRAVRRRRARQPHAAHRRPAAQGRRRDQARHASTT